MLIGCSTLCAGAAAAQSSPAELEAIEERLVSIVPSRPELEVERGGTRFVEHRVRLPASLRDLTEAEVEPRVTGISTPRSVGVAPQPDLFALRDGVMRWLVVLHVAPDAAPGESVAVRYELNLIERGGIGNSRARSMVRAQVRVTEARVQPRDLALDFAGHRRHRARAAQIARRMASVGFRLDLDESASIPSMDRLKPKGVALVRQFVRERHRMNVAARHLAAARRASDPELREIAEAYWRNRDRPPSAWRGVPEISLLEDPADPTPKSSETDEGVLAPIATYTPGTDRPDPPPASPAPSGPSEDEAPTEAERPPPVTGGAGASVADPDAELRRERAGEAAPTLPAYRRGLTLADPNIAFGGSVRLVWAEATVREKALAAAIFYQAQAALTRDLGVEVTVPTQLVSLRDVNAEGVYTNGNPLVALKYRFHLPRWGRRRPALTARARLGVPFSPPSKLPPSDITAEEFTQQVYFVDTWAFLADYWTTGIGASLGWAHRFVSVSAELHLDYHAPLDEDDLGLFTVSYGAGVGLSPVEWITGWAEARATSLVTGLARTEMMAYLGARSRFFGAFEPGAYLGVPIGSIADASSLHVGVDVRISFDREARAGRRRLSAPNAPRGGRP